MQKRNKKTFFFFFLQIARKGNRKRNLKDQCIFCREVSLLSRRMNFTLNINRMSFCNLKMTVILEGSVPVANSTITSRVSLRFVNRQLKVKNVECSPLHARENHQGYENQRSTRKKEFKRIFRRTKRFLECWVHLQDNQRYQKGTAPIRQTSRQVHH